MEVFDLYFASIVAMQLHPGQNRDNAKPLTLEESAELAQQMLKIRETQCLG